jgi:hypothetical protein
MSDDDPFMTRKSRLIVAAPLVVVLLGGLLGAAWLNPRLTRYIETDAFRAELEKETAKGLHFPSAHYEPIKRTGFLTATSNGFQAKSGRKAMKTMEARGLTAKFNPFGLFLRRWQLDEVHIQGGEVAIQVYTPKPEPSPAKPWFHIFLPDRVYLKRVESEPIDVTWQFRGKRAGFFGTRLLITPRGRDFHYEANGGTLKMPLIPDLKLQRTRLSITKSWLMLYRLDLQSMDSSSGRIHVHGNASMREEKSVDLKIDIDRVPVREWLPATWQEHVSGKLAGNVHWTGKSPKAEASSVRGRLELHGGRVVNLPFLKNLAAITKNKSMEQLELRQCSGEIDWKYSETEIKDIAVEDAEKFRIEGSIAVRDGSLGGTIQLGVAPAYLEWLPHAEEVFPRRSDGYLWTVVHLSGKIDNPQQDLSPRVVEVLKESPGAFLGLVFRQLGEWFKNAFESGDK